jgi:hypothetical protein
VVENAEKMDALFVNLVLLFKNAALQQMGKLMNPISGKIEKSMEQARFSIDMIDMLKGKTRGNLSGDLDRLLDSTLLELRMNYVEETEADAKTAAEEKASGGEELKGEPKAETEQAPATPKADAEEAPATPNKTAKERQSAKSDTKKRKRASANEDG